MATISPQFDEKKIQKIINKTYEWENKYHGMTYMQGVRDALRDALEWILGETDEELLSELPDRNPDFNG